jgi:hypothetical protein
MGTLVVRRLVRRGVRKREFETRAGIRRVLQLDLAAGVALYQEPDAEFAMKSAM